MLTLTVERGTPLTTPEASVALAAQEPARLTPAAVIDSVVAMWRGPGRPDTATSAQPSRSTRSNPPRRPTPTGPASADPPIDPGQPSRTGQPGKTEQGVSAHPADDAGVVVAGAELVVLQ
ncbi:hypothetical protein GCM10012279_19030 [Micromonospora yangpuensis]|nr:hypothetical protein GCM10012279_19030 [Micromonospora yangpuensis]